MLDDDITSVGEFVNERGRVVAKKLQWDEWLCKLLDVFNCAANAGYVLFGVSPTANPLCYRKQYTYNTFINGGYVRRECRTSVHDRYICKNRL